MFYNRVEHCIKFILCNCFVRSRKLAWPTAEQSVEQNRKSRLTLSLVPLFALALLDSIMRTRTRRLDIDYLHSLFLAA